MVSVHCLLGGVSVQVGVSGQCSLPLGGLQLPPWPGLGGFRVSVQVGVSGQCSLPLGGLQLPPWPGLGKVEWLVFR